MQRFRERSTTRSFVGRARRASRPRSGHTPHFLVSHSIRVIDRSTRSPRPVQMPPTRLDAGAGGLGVGSISRPMPSFVAASHRSTAGDAAAGAWIDRPISVIDASIDRCIDRSICNRYTLLSLHPPLLNPPTHPFDPSTNRQRAPPAAAARDPPVAGTPSRRVVHGGARRPPASQVNSSGGGGSGSKLGGRAWAIRTYIHLIGRRRATEHRCVG